MGRRKRAFLEDDYSSSNPNSSDEGGDGFRNDGEEDPDERAERQLFEDPYHRKKRQRKGKDDAIYGELDGSDGEGKGSRGGIGKGVNMSRLPTFVTSGPKNPIVDEDEEVHDSGDAEGDGDEGEEVVDMEDSSNDGEQSDAGSRPASPRTRHSDEEGEESSKPSTSFASLTAAAKAFSLHGSGTSPQPEDAAPSAFAGRGGIGSSTRLGIGSHPSTEANLPTGFGASTSSARRPQRSFVRSESGTSTPNATLSAHDALHFSKLQGSFGAKMMAKMGWTAGMGLGAKGEGIAVPIESKLRPVRAGIAHGGFRERTNQSITEARRRGEHVSDDEEDARTAKKKGKGKAVKAQETREQWKKPPKKKTVVQHRTYEEIMEEAGQEAGTSGVGVIIDATGATPREVSSLTEISASPWGATNDPMRLPELRHNLRLIVDMAKGELDGLAREAKALQERKKWIHDEDAKLRKMVSEEAELIQRLQKVHLIVDDIKVKSQEVATLEQPSLGIFSAQVMALIRDYKPEYERYRLDEIIVAAIAPVMRRLLAEWSPLEDPAFLTTELRTWKKALRMSAVPEEESQVEVYGSLKAPIANANTKLSTVMTPYETLLWTIWLPKVRSCINNQWDGTDSAPLIQLLEAWSDILPRFIWDNVFDQLILPKLQKTISEWDPKRSKTSLHGLVFPWLPHVGLRLEHVLDDARRKVKTLFRSWTTDRGVPEELLVWKNVFDAAGWENMLLKYIVPKLGVTLRDDFKINPRKQDMEPLKWVLAWSTHIRPSILAQLLETEFFPKWLSVLHLWLVQPSVNFEEVMQWYSFWKSAFPEEVYAIPGVKHGFTAGLQLMNDAMDLGASAPQRLKKPSFKPLSSTSAPDLGSEKKRPVAAGPGADITFRSIVEDYAAQHNLLFIPTGKTHEKSRMPLYKVSTNVEGKGGITVYVLDDAVWAPVDGGEEYRAIGLDEMVLRATKVVVLLFGATAFLDGRQADKRGVDFDLNRREMPSPANIHPTTVHVVLGLWLVKFGRAGSSTCRQMTKIEQSFALAACSFTISYKDDDGEITVISNDYDLVEAIQYFQAGDDLPSGSGSSIASGRSGLGRRITLRVQVVVDYDGPSLSDTASLSSLEDYPRHRLSPGSNAPSLSLGGGSISGYSLGGELEDDAVTVSSRANRVAPSTSSSQHLPPMPRNYRLPDHSVPSVATSPPSPPLSEDSEPVLVPPNPQRSTRSVTFRDGGSSSISHPTFSSIGTSQEPVPVSSSQSSLPPEPEPPIAVFERLKLAESSASLASGSYPGGPSAVNERSARWLQEQNARVLKSMIGEAAPSASSDSSSVMLPDSEGLSQNGIRGDLELQRDLRGRFYYTYTSDSISQSGYRESLYSEEVTSPLDRRISTSSQNLAWLANHQASAGPSRSPRQPHKSADSLSVASLLDRPLPELPPESAMRDIELSKVPPELLPFLTPASDMFGPPEKVTNCSNCSMQLDTFRYVCSICGEKPAHPQGQRSYSQDSLRSNDDAQYDLKGKGKATGAELGSSSTSLPRSTEPQPIIYPPNTNLTLQPTSSHSPSPASPGSMWGLLGDRDHSISSTLSNIFRSKRQGFRKLGSKPSLQGSEGSDRSNSSVLSLPETAVGGTSPTSPKFERQKMQAQAFEQGYELCANCITTAGVSHAHEGALDLSSACSVGSSLTLVSTPMSSPDDGGSTLRRSAPSERGRMRHAFVEKVWNGSEWKAIEQDDKVFCSICGASLATKRFKCASCSQFNLCRGCYSQVHEIHPSHVFLAVPDKPTATPPVSPPEIETTDEQSLKHPDVTCYHCGLEIFGARFHCAVCQSVDICQNCESAGLPGNLTTATDGGHDSSHIMIKIPYPLDSTEVAFASRRARVLWSGRDAATIDAMTKRITSRSRSNSIDSANATTVIASARRGEQNAMDHMMKCNGCNGQIMGVRYQCANCPSFPMSYNLCMDCEKMSFIIHPLPHVFLKFNRRVDRPIQIPRPLLPILYEEPPAGDFVDSVVGR
ncbi:hypothetical protein FRB99_006936 [Tulasnella sp. 403]|nr:hypothetical protein FRB99_006936 [Tulasnella sp. 403]